MTRFEGSLSATYINENVFAFPRSVFNFLIAVAASSAAFKKGLGNA